MSTPYDLRFLDDSGQEVTLRVSYGGSAKELCQVLGLWKHRFGPAMREKLAALPKNIRSLHDPQHVNPEPQPLTEVAYTYIPNEDWTALQRYTHDGSPPGTYVVDAPHLAAAPSWNPPPRMPDEWVIEAQDAFRACFADSVPHWESLREHWLTSLVASLPSSLDLSWPGERVLGEIPVGLGKTITWPLDSLTLTPKTPPIQSLNKTRMHGLPFRKLSLTQSALLQPKAGEGTQVAHSDVAAFAEAHLRKRGCLVSCRSEAGRFGPALAFYGQGAEPVTGALMSMLEATVSMDHLVAHYLQGHADES